ncbi:MAG: alanine--tRNA ligase, partial [Bacteroidales bacterium]|nr:alanine--tRNA ligase [Bacteroidales bacterium]
TEQDGISLIVADRLAGAGVDPQMLRGAALLLQKELKNTAIAAAYEHEGKTQLLLMYSDDLVAAGRNAGKDIRDAAKSILGGGGGQPGLATAGGKEVAGLGEALRTLIAKATGK